MDSENIINYARAKKSLNVCGNVKSYSPGKGSFPRCPANETIVNVCLSCKTKKSFSGTTIESGFNLELAISLVFGYSL